MAETRADVVVIGGGIVGLTAAYTLLGREPAWRVLVLEKEPGVARHQSGRNSGVIHSGAFYRPGSAKARLCVRGRELLLRYLDAHGLPYRLCGKLVVATTEAERPALDRLLERARANGVPGVERLDATALRAHEPAARGVDAVHIPTTGIVDYALVARNLVHEIERRGGAVELQAEVTGFQRNGGLVRVETTLGDVETRFVVNCAGLYSDEIARLAGDPPDVRIIPFRGEFYTVRKERGLELGGPVYPAPHPTLPFVGIHATPTLEGGVEAGPNAVLALAREGYTRGRMRIRDLAGTLTYPGFPRLIWRLRRMALDEEFRSLSRERFAADLSRLIPGISAGDLVPRDAGVRAQAVAPDGSLVDDFAWGQSPRFLHVLNAPSPAATSSFAIAEAIVGQVPSDP